MSAGVARTRELKTLAFTQKSIPFDRVNVSCVRCSQLCIAAMHSRVKSSRRDPHLSPQGNSEYEPSTYRTIPHCPNQGEPCSSRWTMLFRPNSTGGSTRHPLLPKWLPNRRLQSLSSGPAFVYQEVSQIRPSYGRLYSTHQTS